MKNFFKRMPLWGMIRWITSIFLLITIISQFVYYSNECEKLEIANDVLNGIIAEKDITIKDLKSQLKTKDDKVAELTKQVQSAKKQTITTQPKEQSIRNVSSKSTSRNNSDRSGRFKVTAYCNCTKCCGKWAGGPTASGVMPQQGRTIAVDPKVIPLGAKVVIDGHTYTAEDTGSAIKGNKIDLYFNDHSQAMSWGVQYKNVQVIR